MIHDQMDPENAKSWRLTKAAIFALLGIGAIVWVILDKRDAARQEGLLRTGTSVQGKITGFEDRRGGQHLTVSYEFSANGVTHRIDKRRVGDFNDLTADGPVAVWFDPADPRRCVIRNELSHVRFGWTPYLYGGVIVIMMGLAALQARQVFQPSHDPSLRE